MISRKGRDDFGVGVLTPKVARHRLHGFLSLLQRVLENRGLEAAVANRLERGATAVEAEDERVLPALARE